MFNGKSFSLSARPHFDCCSQFVVSISLYLSKITSCLQSLKCPGLTGNACARFCGLLGMLLRFQWPPQLLQAGRREGGKMEGWFEGQRGVRRNQGKVEKLAVG